MRSTLILLLSSFLACSSLACDDTAEKAQSGQEQLSTVSVEERAAIMDGLRARVKPDLANQDVVFDVSHGSFRVAQNFCWLMGRVELRAGGDPSLQGTIYDGPAKEGLFDGFRIEALLKKNGTVWEVVDHAIGSTDVWYDGIEDRVPGVPRSIFPYLDQVTHGADDPASGAGAPSERMAIMNALRVKVKPELAKQDILFNVQGGSYRVADDFCWLQGKIQLRAGGDPSTKGTLYEEAAREGLFDGFHVEALLKKDGAFWTVVAHGIGSTDVWYAGIENRVPGVPRSIFPQLDKH
jgi:hypothetical protein